MKRVVALVCMLVCGAEATAYARETAPPPPPPATAQAQGQPATSEDGDDVAPLDRRVTLRLRNVLVANAVRAINEQARLRLNYSDRLLPTGKRITLEVEHMPAKQALEKVLEGTGAVVRESAAGDLVLVSGEESRQSGVQPDTTQAFPVFGVVKDSVTNQRLPGVMVSVKGTALTVRTNNLGYFLFWKVPPGLQVVMVRHPGFAVEQHEVMVMPGKELRVNFSLQKNVSRLQEMVITATGRQRRLELGSDITVLNADSIVATQPITSVTDLLEGRVPGLVVLRTSGAPGDPARLRLRGVNSPQLSNDPIVIVDGVRVYSEQSNDRGANLASFGTSSSFAAPSPLDYIDPNSIETIEVVKGASAATLYGQDAANGVIIITTKKGRAGPARWTASTERGMTEMAGSYPDLMLRLGHALTSDERVFCPINNRSGGFGSSICQADSTVRFQMLNDRDLTVLDQGSRTAATVGVSGGSEALTYNVTGTFRDEVGLVKLPEYEAERYRNDQGSGVPDWMSRPQSLTQWGASSRLTARLSRTADVSLSAILSRTSQQRSNLEQQLGSLMSTYLDRSSGRYYNEDGFPGMSASDELTMDYHQRATAVATKFTNGVNLNWRVRPWLTTTANAGIDIVQRDDETFIPTGFGLPLNRPEGALDMAQGTSVMSTVNVSTHSNIPIGRGFMFRLATGVDYTGVSVKDLTGRTFGLAKGTESPNDAVDISDLSQRRVEQATFGWYIEPQISHRRFWLSSGIRLDGGSTFGTQLKLPAFPKLSFSYLVSDESFFPFKDLVPVLRLRVAYGQAGRQPGPTDRLRLYNAATPVWVDGKYVDGVGLKSIGNSELGPERTTEIEGGFDADLLADRLTLSFTGYRKTTTDALLAVPVAPSVYGSGVRTTKNVGVIRNAGVEASLGARVFRTDPLTWDVQVAVSQQRNMVVELGPGVEPFYTELNEGGGTRVAPGYPLFGRWTRPMLGYADANGNGILEQDEVLVGDTAVFVGGTLPSYTANLHTTVTFLRGAVAVSAGFLYENGMTQSNEVGRRLAPFTAGWNDPKSSLQEQARTWDRTGYSWIQTVSTLRFNSLAVTYNIPSYMTRRLRARALSVSLQGTNLGLRTNYRGVDPNVNAYSTGNAVTDTGVLPRPRTWQVRLNANY